MERILLALACLFCCVNVSNAQNLHLSQLTNKKSTSDLNTKLRPSLLELEQEYFTAIRQGRARSEFTSSQTIIMMAKDKVRIQASAVSDVNLLIVELEKLGATQVDKFGRIVNAWLPIENISRLANIKSLKFVKPVYHVGGDIGAADSEGDSALQAMKARIDFCVDGTGVRVGVISDSYTSAFPGGAANGVASGDLPGVGNPNGFTTPVTVVAEGLATDIDEGRAMCEIIHDLAPGAELYFSTDGGGDATFANAILNLESVSNCDIIVDDIRLFEEPFYMDGPIALAVDTVFNRGVPYFASAGNYGIKSYESGYRDSGGGLNAHDFDPGAGVDTLQSITVSAGSTINFTLQWDDAWGSYTPVSALTDLDVFLRNAAGTTVASSEDNNIGVDPTEFFSYAVPNVGGTLTYDILITRAGGPAPLLLKWVVRNNNGLVINEYPPSTVNEMATGYGHSNATGANAVAAAEWINTPAFGTNPPQPESFTSNGGVQIRYDGNGVAIAPVTRNKPNFCAVDGTSNTFFGNGNNFFGTSAAAPHAAAVAALMLQANPGLTPQEVRDALVASSIDMLTAGFDYTTGSGLIQADVALQNVADPCAVSIHDPCACLNNATTLLDGQFSDSVVVWGPTGQMWEVSQISGLFDIMSSAPPAAPTPIAIGTMLVESPAGSGTYVLTGIHVDSIGYSISVTNGTTTLSINNFCVYPTPSIILEAVVVCENGDPIPLNGDPGDDNFESESYTIDGLPATEIDPEALGAGIHTIIYTVDGGVPKDVDDFDPGCVQSVTMDFEIIALVSMACYEEINYSLDVNCEATNLDSVLFGDMFVPELHTFQITTEKGELVDVNNIRDYIGQRLKYSVISLCNENSCWGYINIEDKLGPQMDIPEDVTIYCVESILPIRTGSANAIDCEGVEKIYYLDETESYMCTTESVLFQKINRTWIAVDNHGNTSTGIQMITVNYFPDSLLRNPEVLVELSCKDDVSPEGIATKLGIKYAYPYYVDTSGMFVSAIKESICNFAVTYKDGPKIDVCQLGCTSSYKFIRTWTIANWCTGTVTTVAQLIKVSDYEAPVIVVSSPDKVYAVDAWGCETDIVLPVALVTDNCDEHAKIVAIDGPLGVEVKIIGGKWTALGVPKGTHTFTYTASDCCGNQSTAIITVTVVDKTAPVATAKEFIVVTLTRSGGQPGETEEPGVAKVFAAMIDNGSYDNCTGVKLEIRREADDPSCLNIGVNGYNNNLTYDNTGHTNDANNDTDGGAYVKFCCEDVGGEHKVWLRVWDDADMDGVYGSAGDHYNETWGMVKIEDKFVPTIVCEKDITTYCDRADIVLSLNKWTDVAGNVPAEYWPWIDGVCTNQPLEFMDQGTITTCNTTLARSPLTRTYRIKGTNITCTSSVYILDRETEPKLDWPIALHTWTKCELTVEDVLNNTVKATGINNIIVREITETSQIPLVEIFEYVPYYWYEWMGTGHNSPNLGQYCLGSQNNNIASSGTNGVTPSDGGLIDSLEGKTRFNPNWRDIGCRVFGRKIIIDEYEVGEGCKKWLVRFEYIDWCNPDWAACVTTIFKYEDTTPGEIVVSMSDTISVDPTCNTSWTTMPMGDDGGGCDVGFFWEVTLSKADYTKTLTATGNGPKITFTGLGSGKYNVHYKLTDGCGNVSEKDGMLLIIGKDPTPYCISLSSAVMKNGVVELWARDFDNGSFPNCRGGNLYYTFENAHPVLSKLNQYHFFMGEGIEVKGADTTSLYLAGIAQKWLPATRTSGKLFGCGVGDGSSFPVSKIKMTVWDEDFLSDFCEVTLSLVDNQEACGEAGMILSGVISTEASQGLAGVEVSLEASLIGYPRTTFTDNTGVYTFQTLGEGINYEVVPKLDGEARNGVNTLDLVHIQRHILALKKLDSPYKQIAADVTNDGAIRVEDLVSLRKLILGVTDVTGPTASWRFVDGAQQMGDKPWPFNEMVGHTDLHENKQDKFVAVKMGDVDGSAKVNATDTKTAPRSQGVSMYIVDRKVNAGETFEVAIRASNFNEVHGMQLSAELDGLTLISAEGRGINLDNDNVAMPKAGTMTMSWAGIRSASITTDQEIMRLTFQATKTGQISEMISAVRANGNSPKMEANSNSPRSEAYIGQDMTTTGISLEIRNGQAGQFALYQNEPNPWKGETVVKYELPEAGQVTIRIFDIAGKNVFNQTSTGQKGFNTLTFSKEQLNGATGVLIYKIEAGKYSAQKRMIVIE